MLIAAFTSRSWAAPHGQAHDRTLSGILSAIVPHAEHGFELGNQRSIRANVRPYRFALYSSMPTNWDQPASCTLLASLVRPRPDTDKFSTYTAWLSRMISVESLCAQSRRASDTLACALATFSLAFCLFAEPFSLRESALCALRKRRSARRSRRGLSTFRPSDITAKWVRPRSMPISSEISGNGSSAALTTNDAKYRPALSLITVTDDGSDGSERDQMTGTSPIFGRRSLPPGVIANRAFLVKRIACRESLRDAVHGGKCVEGVEALGVVGSLAVAGGGDHHEQPVLGRVELVQGRQRGGEPGAPGALGQPLGDVGGGAQVGTVGDGEADSRDGHLHRILAAAGVPAEELVPVRKVLYAFVSGFLSAESSGVLAELSGESDPDDTFEAAVDLIVAGLESRPSPMTPG